jgi:enterochelin esterase family protein
MRIPLLLFVSLSIASAQVSPPAPAPAVTPKTLLKLLSASPAAGESADLERQVLRLWGKQSLMQGRAAAKVEGTTVAWAIMDSKPAQVVAGDGSVIGAMVPLGQQGLQVLVKEMPNFREITYQIKVEGTARLGGSLHIEDFKLTRDSEVQAGVPQGRLEKFTWNTSKIFPDTVRTVTVYIPQQYQPGSEACLMVWQDGSRHVDPKGGMRASVVFDNLIHKKEMPVTIGVFIDPGSKPNQKPGQKPANRGFEYDSLGSAYVTLLLDEILPEVQRRFGVRFRQEPEAWGIAGGSSGGICSFTAAWERPDKFRKVLSWVGTFVDIRGGNAYPYLIRITEPKPLRVYLLDGTNDLDNQFGNWPIANRMMAASLKYMNYDFRIDWTQCFHGSKGMAPALPDALRWLWRDVK